MIRVPALFFHSTISVGRTMEFVMRTKLRAILPLAIFLVPVVAFCIDGIKAKMVIPAGTFGGCSQKMLIGENGAISYDDRLSLTSIRIDENGDLHASFPTDDDANDSLLLRPAAAEDSRLVWKTQVNHRDYKAKAIPHSPEMHSFRLEVRQDGKLIAGAQAFFAISKGR
jgi:hypothetical protein